MTDRVLMHRRCGILCASRVLPVLVLASLLGGCAGFAPRRLYQDQLGYTQSLGDGGKAQTLLNIVRLRFGDVPQFLNTTQVISGYTLQQNFSGALTVVPGGSNTLAGTPGVAVTQSPTFTFQPVTGEALASSFLRPISPTELLPLSLSGTPIDVLFRLAIQSVNGLNNSSMLDTAHRTGSPGFAHLLIDLRQLQIAGQLGVRLAPGTEPGDEKSKVGGKLILSIPDSADPDIQKLVLTTRQMLGMAKNTHDAEVRYGSGRAEPGTITLLTRPVLGMLVQVASEVEVASEDVTAHRTIATVDDAAILGRPVVIIHSGEKSPKDVFSMIRYKNRSYWIDDTDFDSKVAFSVLQTLMALGQSNPPTNTVVTIPAH